MSCCPEPITEIKTIEIVEDKETEEQFLLNKESRSEQRMAICRQCPDLMALNMCRYCKCFMNVKTRIYSAKCPVGKW
jgi:hypothetical protein